MFQSVSRCSNISFGTVLKPHAVDYRYTSAFDDNNRHPLIVYICSASYIPTCTLYIHYTVYLSITSGRNMFSLVLRRRAVAVFPHISRDRFSYDIIIIRTWLPTYLYNMLSASLLIDILKSRFYNIHAYNNSTYGCCSCAMNSLEIHITIPRTFVRSRKKRNKINIKNC